jgi:hypothetical protein
MKKMLLSTSLLFLGLTVSAQLFETDGFLIDNINHNSNCMINAGLPNHGGIMNVGESTFTASANTNNLTINGLELTGASSIKAGANPTWFPLHVAVGAGERANCSTLFSEDSGVDLTSQSMVTVLAKSTAVGDTLEFFLGGIGQWGPATSTYNTGSGIGIAARCVFTQAGVFETFSFDFSAIDATVWGDWTSRNKVQSIGYRAGTPDANYVIQSIAIGSASLPVGVASVSAASISVYPNPATDKVNVTVGSGNASVSLSDVTGAVVASGNGSGTVALSTANVSAGLYVVSVSSAAGTTTSKVVVK